MKKRERGKKKKRKSPNKMNKKETKEELGSTNPPTLNLPPASHKVSTTTPQPAIARVWQPATLFETRLLYLM